MQPPDGSKAVLLTEHREGQCRDIIGYQDSLKAMMCGEPVVRRRDGHTPSSWCAYHHARYITRRFVRESNRAPTINLWPEKKQSEYDALKYMTLTEASQRYRIPAPTLRSARASGAVASQLVKGRAIVAIADVERLAAKRTKPLIAASSVVA
jgi:hypothetical protein